MQTVESVFGDNPTQVYTALSGRVNLRRVTLARVPKILIVDDDQDTRQLLKIRLHIS